MHFYSNFGQLDYKTFYLIGYDNGQKYTRTFPLERTYFTTNDLIGSPSPYKNVYGVELNQVSDSESRSLKKDSGVELYSAPSAIYETIHRQFPGSKGVKYDFSLIRAAFIDIETETEEGFPNIQTGNEKINLITVRQGDRVYTLGLHPLKKEIPGVTYICTNGDEQILLRKFVGLIQRLDPDIITGWNVKFFDLIYLANRFRFVFGGTDVVFSEISPVKKINRKTTEVFNKQVEYVEIEGISTVDYMDAYKKFIMKNQESLSLDAIAEKELGDKKVPWKDKFETFRDFYLNDWDMFVEYNVHDVNLVHALDQKKKYLRLVAAIIYRSKVNFSDVFSQVKMWEQLIYCTIEEEKKIIPPVKEGSRRVGIKGAYVKPPIPGRHLWTTSVDATSLYPSIDIQFNISPETIQNNYVEVSEFNKLISEEGNPDLTETLVESDLIVAANGTTYSKGQVGFIPEIMASLFSERKQLKNEMLRYKNLKELVGARMKELENSV